MRLPSWTKPRVAPAPTEPTPRPSPRRTPQRANSDSALLPIAQSPKAAGRAAASPARAPPLPSPGTPNDLECEELHLDRDQRSSSKPRYFFQGAAFAPAVPTNDSPGARVRSGMVAAGYRLEMPAPTPRRARREAPEETCPEDATASARRYEFRSKPPREAPAAPGVATRSKPPREALAAPASEAAADGSGPTRPRPGRSASEPCLLPSRHRDEEDALPTDATEDDVEAEPHTRHQRKGTSFVAATAAVVAAIL